MENKRVPVTIYAESTPNPSTMKFVANKILVNYGATVEYKSADECEDAPLARVLFTFPFVEKVFMSGNFVSISKADFIDWDDVVLEVREYLTNYIQAGNPIFDKPPVVTQHETQSEANGEKELIKVTSTPQNEMEEKIINILEEYVRPAVESDGGAIHFKNYENGKLTVKLSGACNGCPSATQTLKGGIQSLFERMLPEVKEVVSE